MRLRQQTACLLSTPSVPVPGFLLKRTMVGTTETATDDSRKQVLTVIKGAGSYKSQILATVPVRLSPRSVKLSWRRRPTRSRMCGLISSSLVPLPGFVLKRAMKGAMETATDGLRKQVLKVKKGG